MFYSYNITQTISQIKGVGLSLGEVPILTVTLVVTERSSIVSYNGFEELVNDLLGTHYFSHSPSF